jgi:hypothetical protein
MGADKYGVTGGVSSGAFRVEPWHGYGDSVNKKGVVVGRKVPITDDIKTGRDLLVTAGLNWNTEKRTLAELGLGQERADEYAAIIRTDCERILGIHSDRYGMVQNEVLGQYMDVLMKARGDAQPVSAVELYGGRVLFLVVEFRDLVKVVRKDGDESDKMTRYMGIYTSHDGSYPLGVKYMQNLWVCMNTFTPWNATTGFIVRHTRNASDIASQAVSSLERMITTFDQFDAEIQRLLDIEADKRTLTQKVIPAVIGKRPTNSGRSQTMYDNTWDEIVAEWNDHTRQETAFDAVMAIQGFEQHRSTVRNSGRDIAAIRRVLDDRFPLTTKAVSVFS